MNRRPWLLVLLPEGTPEDARRRCEKTLAPKSSVFLSVARVYPWEYTGDCYQTPFDVVIHPNGCFPPSSRIDKNTRLEAM